MDCILFGISGWKQNILIDKMAEFIFFILCHFYIDIKYYFIEFKKSGIVLAISIANTL